MNHDITVPFLNWEMLVMATHAVQYPHQADHVIALSNEGKVVEQGSV